MNAQQYEFQVSNLATGGRDQVRATARSHEEARAAVVGYYGRTFQISDQAIAVRPAHQVLGEIDCM